MYDPAGNDINLGDFACFDDQVCNVVMNFYEDGNYNPTEAKLDALRKKRQESYQLERSMYKDSGEMIIPDEES